jgi:hypothetical protein
MKRLIVLATVISLGLLASGCTKCGFWWDEGHAQACKGDFPK